MADVILKKILGIASAISLSWHVNPMQYEYVNGDLIGK